MKKMTLMLALALGTMSAAQAASNYQISKEWTFTHSGSGYLAEIPAYDAITNTLWVAGVKGVDVLNASTGSFLQHIDTSAYGSINSVSISNGLAAFAIENNTRTNAGIVQLYDT
ncbi:MAG: choice-of-anchor I family protein, partial [Methylophilus sp.]